MARLGREQSALAATAFYFTAHIVGILVGLYRNAPLFHAPTGAADILSKILFVVLGLSAFTLFVRARDSNPGYVTGSARSPGKDREPAPEVKEDEDLEKGTTSVETTGLLPICKLCDVAMPLRTRHCRECNKCVARFDHHCVYIANCVGEGNHRLFFTFVSVETIWHLSVIPQLYGCIIWYPTPVEFIVGNYILLPIFMANFIFLIITAMLAGYHAFLICTAQTSWEHGSDRVPYMQGVPDNVLPFDRGVRANCHDFWFRAPHWPPYVKQVPEMRPDGTYPPVSGLSRCINSCC